MKVFKVSFISLIAGIILAGLIVSLVVIEPADSVAANHGPFTISSATYRVPYADGLTITAFNDHHNHPNAPDRDDMGVGAGNVIVAEASGVIRGIVDWHGSDDGRGDSIGVDGVTPQDDGLENNVFSGHKYLKGDGWRRLTIQLHGDVGLAALAVVLDGSNAARPGNFSMPGHFEGVVTVHKPSPTSRSAGPDFHSRQLPVPFFGDF